MVYSKLPPIESGIKMEFSHFPDRFHAAVFRLWETASVSRIAAALNVDEAVVAKTAENMGLPTQKYTDRWERRGYITTIRNAWHILPYDALLRLLDVDEESLARILKEDDFLGIKLGDFKPFCEKITLPTLDESGEKKLRRVREITESNFFDMFSGKAPFDFFDGVEKREIAEVGDGLRMIYSYCGLYATALDNDIELSYPDSLLSMYSEMGVNAIWLPALLYQLVPFYFDPKYSEGWEKRTERLNLLVGNAKKYGIKVYLYLNEPRCMPEEFFEDHVELRGKKNGMFSSLCTSCPEVMKYLRYAVRTLCENVRGLGGFFTITCSENLTHCKSVGSGEMCERCKDRSVSSLVAEVITAIYEESTAVDQSIRNIAWTWAWDDYMTEDEIRECIDMIPEGVVIQCNSEAKQKFTRGGIDGEVRDYSISVTGPAPYAMDVWRYAREKGHEVSAKVQVNCTWECSTVPYLPVFDLIRKHMKGLKRADVDHLMLSWTLGGYPSINLKIASDCLNDGSEESYFALLQREYGEWAETVKRSATAFSEAFEEFPFELLSLYMGPQNSGPSNPLYLEKTGLRATMTCYSYDDLDYWRANYPREIYLEQYRLLSEKWKRGLDMLENMPDCSFLHMAKAAYLIFRSAYLQIRFIIARDGDNRADMIYCADEEYKNAVDMYRLILIEPLLGYEAANHYYYNKGALAEKAIICDGISKMLKEKF